MNERRTLILSAIIVLLLIALGYLWIQRGGVREEQLRLNQELAACRAEASQTKTELAACKDELAALKKGEPVPGPIIDITPQPNENNNHFTIGGTPAQAVTPSNNELNAKFFGKVLMFRATFEVNGNTVVRDLAAFRGKLGGLPFEVKRVGTNPENVGWKLNAVDLVKATTTMPDHHVRSDMCTALTDITWDLVTPENPPGGTFKKLEIQVEIPGP